MFERWFAPVWERVSEQCALQHQHQQLSRAERFDHSPEQTFISSICIGTQHFYRLRCILALLLHVEKYWRRCHLHHNQSRLISINVVCRLIALSHHHSEALDSWAMINKQYHSQSDVLCVEPRRKNEWKWERDSEEESDLDARTHFETEQIAHKLPDCLSVCPGDRTLLPTTGRRLLADDDLHSSSSSAILTILMVIDWRVIDIIEHIISGATHTHKAGWLAGCPSGLALPPHHQRRNSSCPGTPHTSFIVCVWILVPSGIGRQKTKKVCKNNNQTVCQSVEFSRQCLSKKKLQQIGQNGKENYKLQLWQVPPIFVFKAR